MTSSAARVTYHLSLPQGGKASLLQSRCPRLECQGNDRGLGLLRVKPQLRLARLTSASPRLHGGDSPPVSVPKLRRSGRRRERPARSSPAGDKPSADDPWLRDVPSLYVPEERNR